MSLPRNLTTETLQLLATSMGSMVVGLLGTILVTRALGAEGRGVYAWLLTVSSLAVTISVLAQPNIVRKLAVEKRGEHHWPTLLGSLISLNIVGSLLTTPLLMWAWLQPLGSAYPLTLAIAFASVPFMAATGIMVVLIQLRRKTLDIILSTLLPRLLVVALIALAWTMNSLSITTAVFLNTLIGILGILVVHAWTRLPLAHWKMDRLYLRAAAGFIGAGWVSGLAGFAMPKIPLLLLPHYVPLADIGHFSLATTLLDIALMVPAAVTSVLVSHFTRSGSSASGRLKTLAVLSILLMGMAVVGYALAPLLLPWLFGAEFLAAVAPFRLLLLALLLQAPLAVLSGAVTADGRPLGVLLPPVAGLAASFGMSFLLLPSGGIFGACWAIITGYLVQLIVLAGLVRLQR